MNLKSLISSGNKKLPRSTAIFNMCSASDCPSRKLGLCQAINKAGKNVCYAKKSENAMRPNVLPYRRRQEKYWKGVTADKFVADFIALNTSKRKPFKALRINESGDFSSQSDVEKVDSIAEKLMHAGVKLYMYTARKDLDFSNIRHARIMGSGFMKQGLIGIFKYINSEKENDTGYKLCVGDCRKCNACLVGANRAIVRH